MLEGFTITQTLSLLFGLYFLSAGIGILFDRNSIGPMFDTMIENEAIGFLMGIVAFVLGALIISIHSDWNGILASIITLFGWIALAEGMLMLAFRKWFLGLFSFMARSSNLFTGFAIFTILMGVVFIFAAFQIE